MLAECEFRVEGGILMSIVVDWIESCPAERPNFYYRADWWRAYSAWSMEELSI